jgi:gliding motility-associated-like protein
MKKCILGLLIILPFLVVGQNNCFEIKSILVDACGSPEGPNEMVRIEIGSNPLNTSDFQANWPNNPYRGLCQSANTASNVAYMNSTIQSCGYFLEPQNGVLPAGAQVLIITSVDFDPTAHNYAGLMDTIYVVFQCAGNTSGHFANWVNNCDPSSGNRTTTISFGVGCTQTKTYNRCFLTNQNGGIGGNAAIRDGARVDFGSNNTTNYINDGCTIPVGNLSVSAAISSGQLPVCPNDTLSLVGQVTGITANSQWQSSYGVFSTLNSNSVNYSVTANQDHYVYFQAEDGCGNVIKDSIFITVSELADLTLELIELNSSCGPGSIALNAQSDFDILWSTGETTSQIIPQTNGYYTATVNNICGNISDSIFVDFQVDFDLELDYQETICQYSEGNFLNVNIVGGNSPHSLTYTTNGISNTISVAGTAQINLSSTQIGENIIVLSYIEDQTGECTLELNDTLYYEVLPDISLINFPSSLDFCQGENAILTINSNAASSAYLVYEILGQNTFYTDTVMGQGSFTLTIPSNESGEFQLTFPVAGYEGLDCENALTDTILIKINSLPSGGIMGDTTICQYADKPFFNLFTGSEFLPVVFVYTVNDEEYSFNSNSMFNSIPFETSAAGEFTIQLLEISSHESGCASIQNSFITINVVPPPVIDFVVNPSEMFDDFTTPQFMNFTQGASEYYWDFGDGNNSIDRFPWHNYNPEGEEEYEIALYATNDLGCIDSSFTTIRYVIHDQIYVPNTFTPDGNKSNEIFIPVLNGRFDPFDYELTIFNRWGELIFESRNPKVGWDGNYLNNIAPDGVYIWKLRIGLDYNDHEIVKSGHVTLIR